MSFPAVSIAIASALRAALPLLFIGPLFLLSFTARVQSNAASRLLAAWNLYLAAASEVGRRIARVRAQHRPVALRGYEPILE